MAVASPPPANPALALRDREAERRLREAVREKVDRLLGERHLLAPGREEEAHIRAIIHEHVESYQHAAATTNRPLLADAAGVEQRLFDSLVRLGILSPLLADDSIEEICINGCARIWVVQHGAMRLLPDLYFDSDEELLDLIRRVIGPLGRRLDESSPMVDARLPDGSRLNAVIPPVTLKWPAVTIRKFLIRAERLDQLLALDTLTEDLAEFLDVAVQAGVNMLIAGGAGTGKTTLLNCLISCIRDPSERIICLEETAELQLHLLPNCVAEQARPANLEGAGEITLRQLVKNALRQRPSRIIVGEVRSEEALDCLLAMNSGHRGSITTVHGETPRDALDRLVVLASMAAERTPLEALRHMAAHTIELVIQMDFARDGGRRLVTSVFEVTGTEDGVIAGNELWRRDEQGRLVWTGIPPRCADKFRARGLPYTPPRSAAGHTPSPGARV
ncbi:MAG TPA: ATPase, T2SS/T4P/T4SS family [Chloroflexota bacterium]|nr:ATPase, T2SS/T4P/T4SS family [Chloroflexota bacterium]